MTKQRLILVLLLIVIIPVGFLTKYYSGPAEDWVNNSLGGLFYEIFWCLIFAFIYTKTKAGKIAFWVFIITCLFEFLQLWHPAFIEVLRNNFIGRTILGNSFNWMDFPYYFVGCLIAYFMLIGVKKLSEKAEAKRHTSGQ